jgi:hypothetical protein
VSGTPFQHQHQEHLMSHACMRVACQVLDAFTVGPCLRLPVASMFSRVHAPHKDSRP